MRFLCIFAIPRTGSSHLNKLLKSCRGVDAKSELFHGSARMRFSEGELAQLRDRAGDMVLDAAKFAKWRRRHPAGTLKAIYEGGAPRIVAFKVFQNHLKPEKIQSELLVRDDTGFAVLTRRPIECYISGLKAKSMSRFGAIDTTAIKPTLSAADFAEWADRNMRWYRWIQDALEARGQPYAKLSFEEHLDGLSGEESLARILPLFETIGFPGVQASQRIVEGQRQDKEVRYQDRVANWDEFAAAASADPEFASLFEWSMAAP